MSQAPLTGPSHATILTGLTPLGHGFRNNSGFALPPVRPHGGQTFQGGPLPNGRLRVGLPTRSPLRIRSRIRGISDDHLPRGNDRRADAVSRTFCRRDDRRRAQMGCRADRRIGNALVPVGALLRSARALRAAHGSARALPHQSVRRRDRVRRSRTEPAAATAHDARRLAQHADARHGGSRGRSRRARRRHARTVPVPDATLRVPWIMAGPGIAANRVARTVARSIDILPTLLDYAGVSARSAVDGRSLRPAADGRELSDAPAYAESLYSELELGWAPLHAMRLGRLKFIDAPRAELYDLDNDGGETANLIGDDAGQCRSAAEGPRDGAHPDAPECRGSDRSRGGAAAHGARLRQRQRPARDRREGSATQSQGRHSPDAAPQSRHVGCPSRARRRDPRADRGARRGSEPAHGATDPRRRL